MIDGPGFDAIKRQPTSPEDEARTQLFGFFSEAIDSIVATFEDDKEKASAVAILNDAHMELERLSGAEVESTAVFRRKVREKDNMRLDLGEHPGSTMKISYKDGSTGYINVYGGIRETVSQDYQDTDKTLQRSSMTTTDGIIDKRRQLGIEIFDGSNNPLFASWLVYDRSKSITVTRVAYEKSDGTSIRLDGQMSLNASRPDEQYAFGRVSGQVEALTKQLIAVTPPAVA